VILRQAGVHHIAFGFHSTPMQSFIGFKLGCADPVPSVRGPDFFQLNCYEMFLISSRRASAGRAISLSIETIAIPPLPARLIGEPGSALPVQYSVPDQIVTAVF
jgi:hypothetical protein